MTQQQKDQVARVSWPIVVLAGLAGLFFIGVFVVIPRDMPEARTALLGFLITSATAVVTVVVQRLAGRVADVQHQTNGQMSTLIAAKTQPDVSRETAGEVPC